MPPVSDCASQLSEDSSSGQHGSPALIACHECDFVQQHVDAPPGATVRCRRCRGVIYRHSDKSFDHAIAWSLTGLILLLLANVFPVLHTVGQRAPHRHDAGFGAVALYRGGQPGVAALVVGVLIVAPVLLFLVQIGAAAAAQWPVAAQLRLGDAPALAPEPLDPRSMCSCSP